MERIEVVQQLMIKWCLLLLPIFKEDIQVTWLEPVTDEKFFSANK